MGSKRLERIQTIIEELVEAEKSGAEEQVVAALQALSAPLPPEVKLEQGPQVRAEQTLRHAGVLRRIEEVGHGAEGITAAFTAVNIILGEQLGIEPPAVDQALETGLGLAGQAQNLFIDPETGVVIAGRQAGELKFGQQLNLAKLLAEESGPISQENLAEGIFGPKGKKRSGDVRSLIAKLNRSAEDQGLLPVVVNPGRKGYGLGPGYEILGVRPVEPTIPPVPVKTQAQSGRPESYSISQVLAMEGIAGVLSETQTRRLTQELLAKGHLRVGMEVIEGKAQARGASSKIVRDLELTPDGVKIIRDVANQFGAQSRIHTDDVVNWLEKQGEQPAAPVPQPADARKRYWSSQVSQQTGIPKTAMRVLHQIGAFKEGIHFEKKGRRVYTDEALRVAQQVARQAKTEDQGRFTERLIREAVGLPEEKDDENPFGPNGPKTFTVLHEHAMLYRLQACIPVIEQRTGEPLRDDFKIELAARLGELTTRLTEDEEMTIKPEERERIRRQAAATVLELSQDARPFNFLRSQHPGIEIGLAFIRGVRKAGQKEMIREFAEAIVNPPTKIPDPTTIARDGLIGNTLSVGPMGNK